MRRVLSSRSISRMEVRADTELISGATPYSWVADMPMRYYTRTEGDSAGNAVVVLEGHAFYDSGSFDGFFKSTIKNGLHAADLGSAAS